MAWVCPIMAQPPMPPVSPLAMFPRPWPMHSCTELRNVRGDGGFTSNFRVSCATLRL